MGLPIRPGNEAAKCTMEDCQYPTTKKKFCQSKSRVKIMLLTFFDIRGSFIINLYHPDKQSTKFTIWKYWKGCVRVRRKRPELSANNSWILRHDNASAHTALSMKEILATKQINVLGHPAYLPDLAPRDFFLFRR